MTTKAAAQQARSGVSGVINPLVSVLRLGVFIFGGCAEQFTPMDIGVSSVGGDTRLASHSTKPFRCVQINVLVWPYYFSPFRLKYSMFHLPHVGCATYIAMFSRRTVFLLCHQCEREDADGGAVLHRYSISFSASVVGRNTSYDSFNLPNQFNALR